MKKEAPGEAMEAGDAEWRERQKVKKRASWPWTVGLGVVALGWGAWTRLEWQSRQHPLSLRVLHAAQPGDKGQQPLLDIDVAGAPASSEAHYIEGPQWEVRVRRGAFRPPDKQEWIQGGPNEIEFAEKQLLGKPVSSRVQSASDGSAVRSRWPRESALSLPPGDHTLEVDVEGSFSDEEQHVWSGSTQAKLHIAIPTPTMPTTKVIAGIAKLQYAPGLVSSKPSPNVTVGKATSGNITVNKAMVGQAAAVWRDLPAPGQKGFPAIVPNEGFVSLRVVQSGRKPGDATSFAPLSPRWNAPSKAAESRGDAFWQQGLDFHHLPSSAPGDGAGDVYQRIEVKVEAQDHEIVRGAAFGQVREGERSSMTGWILMRPKHAMGQPIPPFDAASTSE